MKTRFQKVLRQKVSGKRAIQIQLLAETIDTEAKDMSDAYGMIANETIKHIAHAVREIERIIYVRRKR